MSRFDADAPIFSVKDMNFVHDKTVELQIALDEANNTIEHLYAQIAEQSRTIAYLADLSREQRRMRRAARAADLPVFCPACGDDDCSCYEGGI